MIPFLRYMMYCNWLYHSSGVINSVKVDVFFQKVQTVWSLNRFVWSGLESADLRVTLIEWVLFCTFSFFMYKIR